MANQRKQEPRPAASELPVTLLLTGVICLGIGLGIGYYFGRQYAEVSSPLGPGTSQAQTPQPSGGQGTVQDPNAFVQNEASLKASLTANPNDVETLVRLGNLYYDHGQYQRAVDWYGKALEIDPRNANVRTDRGTSYWNLNQPDAAIAEFKKSLDIDPGHAQTLYNMGVVYLHGKNNVEEAKKAWQKLLAANPNYPERAKVEQELSTLAMTAPADAVPAAQKKPGSPSMEELLDRMKSRP
jgi:tetratricopeptide (TPR) repeat protein